MNGLDQVPWKDLKHAYGFAADVPDLLRALRTASPDLRGEESPLCHLFGNIWHQGTVYEATAFAVPFLIELAVDHNTPDRVGILSLLAEIAMGSSYRDVHGNFLNERDWEEKKQQELLWVKRSHDAVAAGFEHFVQLTAEPGDVAYAAANVLARLPIRRRETADIIRVLLRNEQRASYRAGLLLLLASIAEESQKTLAVLSDAVRAKEIAERHAAAYAIVRLQVRPPPVGAREAIAEAIAGEELEVSLQEVPWDATAGLDPDELIAYLNDAAQDW